MCVCVCVGVRVFARACACVCAYACVCCGVRREKEMGGGGGESSFELFWLSLTSLEIDLNYRKLHTLLTETNKTNFAVNVKQSISPNTILSG